MPKTEQLVVLIIEDGNEYLDNLSRFVIGPSYLQAHSGREALAVLGSRHVDIVYLDMRFDRIAPSELLGDHAQATREHNGDPVRALRHLQNNQGLFVLDSMREAGHGEKPVVLAYDFSREQRRYSHLKLLYPGLVWVPDAVTPEQIRAIFEQLVLQGRMTSW